MFLGWLGSVKSMISSNCSGWWKSRILLDRSNVLCKKSIKISVIRLRNSLVSGSLSPANGSRSNKIYRYKSWIHFLFFDSAAQLIGRDKESLFRSLPERMPSFNRLLERVSLMRWVYRRQEGSWLTVANQRRTYSPAIRSIFFGIILFLGESIHLSLFNQDQLLFTSSAPEHYTVGMRICLNRRGLIWILEGEGCGKRRRRPSGGDDTEASCQQRASTSSAVDAHPDIIQYASQRASRGTEPCVYTFWIPSRELVLLLFLH